jgi:glycosyltransferase involved in cell wall biosynthesis
MKILFLYTELADYSMACFKALKASSPECQLLVIHFPINPEAPFKFQFDELGRFICIDRFESYESFAEEAEKFEPKKIVCSGWISKWYIRFCRKYSKNAQCVLCSDNTWRATFKQLALSVIAPATITRIFDKIWVPGEPQVRYAKKLGYKDRQIMRGFYSCDVNRFSERHRKYKDSKGKNFPKRFLCVARYIPAKGYGYLWAAFAEWKRRTANDWELWCAGTGQDFQKRFIHPAIKHFGFVQNEQWDQVIENTGVFILPSLFEPWGVVVHEFAAAGYPLLISERVGASTAFVNGENGFTFDPENIEEIISCFDKISKRTSADLLKMGQESLSLSKQITPSSWAQTLLSS